MSTEPNDILVRITRNKDGSFSRDMAIAINDETMLPEMERTAEFLGKCLEIFGRSDAGLEHHAALRYAEGLAQTSGRIKLLS